MSNVQAMPRAAQKGRLLTVDEAAERLGCRPSFLRRLMREGRITYQKLGPGKRSPVRFREEVLEAFIDASTVEATD